jgi:aspartyl-tRNA(Asn)/glutamyl-tRNA(Gln) amidotransferase subunit C
MNDSIAKVRAIAALARLDLTRGLAPDEAAARLARISAQFRDIVALMDTLSQVDTQGVEPLYWPLAAPAAPLREDAAAVSATRRELLANAPEQDGRFFIVPRIV